MYASGAICVPTMRVCIIRVCLNNTRVWSAALRRSCRINGRLGGRLLAAFRSTR
jgi:hypothetical protein